MGCQASRPPPQPGESPMLFPAEGMEAASSFDFREAAPLKYGMFLMSFKVVIDLPRMSPHQVLLHSGRLRSWSDEVAGQVVFISHEWLGFAHPDPDGEQLAALKSTLLCLARGQVTVQSDWKHQIIHGWNEKLPAEHAAAVIPNCFFWLDYSGVPQRLSEQDLASMGTSADTGLDADGAPRRQLDAIHSIPGYVERSSLVLVLSPTCRHRDRDSICDMSTWRARGWCRVELLCAVLARTNVRVMKLDAGVLAFMAGTEALMLPPGRGAFTCCAHGHRRDACAVECDKVQLRVVVDAMLAAKAAHLSSRGQVLLQRLTTVDRERFLVGFSAPAVAPPFAGAPDAANALRRRLQWTPQDDLAARAGRAPSLLHWAARAGDAAAVKQLAGQSGPGLETPVPRCLPEWSVASGLRPLHLAACAPDPDAMQALLDARASPTAFDHTQLARDALMWAAGYGTVEHLKAWRRNFPDWNLERRTPTRRMTALVSAAFGGPSSAPRLRLLLEWGALPSCGAGVVGPRDAPLLAVCSKDDSDPEAAHLLLEAGCSPNAICQVQLPAWRAALFAVRLLARCQAARGQALGPLLARLAEQDGASALGLAAFNGHLGVARVLLQARADPSRRNKMGRTPLESARHRAGGQATAPLEALFASPPTSPSGWSAQLGEQAAKATRAEEYN